MKIVIELDENPYTKLFDNGLELYPYPYDALAWAVRHGVVLPKGHGRLIDADKLEGIRQLQLMPNGNGKYTEQIIYTQNAIDCAKTVIPADKEEQE